MRRQHILRSIALSVPAFAIAGAISRYNLRVTETRWQVLGFVVLAAGVEMLARQGGHDHASALRGALNAAAAAIIIVSVKFHLEPAARKHATAIVRHAVRTVVEAADNAQ